MYSPVGNSEEDKEKLERISIEYRYGCYRENKPTVCHLLGDFMEAVNNDFDKAAKVYKNNCDDNHFSHSCYKFGNYIVGKRGGLEQDFSEALKYFTKACDGDYFRGCHNAALLHASGRLSGGQKDIASAIPLLEKACKGKEGDSCFHLSAMHIAGDHNVPSDMAKAFQFAKAGCDLDFPLACANLSIMYRKGEGVEANEKLAAKFKERATHLDSVLRNPGTPNASCAGS